MEANTQQSSGVLTTGTEWPHPDGDPRLKWPALLESGFLTKRRIESWRLHQHCLCGCGRSVKLLRGRQGSWSYFTNKCWPRVARAHDLRPPPMAPKLRDPHWLERVLVENDARLCSVEDTKWYVALIRMDCDAQGLSVRSWARQKGVTSNWVYSLQNTAREGRRIKKYTAGAILTALGEPLPPDIKVRHVEHLRMMRQQKKVRRTDPPATTERSTLWRRRQVIKLLNEEPFCYHDDIYAALRARGVQISTGSLSRDFAALGVYRVLGVYVVDDVTPGEDIDEVAVKRALSGDRVPLNRAEKAEVANRLAAQGLSRSEAGVRANRHGRTLVRWGNQDASVDSAAS